MHLPNEEHVQYLDDLDLYFSIFQNAPLGILILDSTGIPLQVNATLSSLLGFSSKEFMTMRLDQMAYPLEAREHASVVDRLLNSKSSNPDLDIRYLCKNGTVMWGKTRAMLVKGEAGRQAYTVIMIEDVTEKKEMQRLKEENVDLLQTIAHTSPNSLYVYDLIQQRLVWQNKHVANEIGYSDLEILEMGNESLARLCHPEDLPKLSAYMSTLVSLEDQEVREIEYRIQHRNGEWRWFLCRNAAFRKRKNGTIGQVIGSATDITERKKAEMSNQKNENRLISILQATDAIVSYLGLDGRVLYVNRVLPSIDKTKFEGSIIFDWFPAEVSETIAQRMEGVQRTKEPLKYENQYIDPEGELHYFYHIMSPVLEEGKVIGVTVISNEITQWKKMSHDLQRANFCMDHASEGIIIHTKEGDIVYANQAIADSLGKQLDQVIHQNVLKVKSAGITPESWKARWKKVKEQKHLVETKQLQSRSGTKVIMETSISHTVFHDSEYTITFSRDISERKMIEEALRKSEAKLRSVIEGTDAIVTLLDLDGTVLYVNHVLPGIDKAAYLDSNVYDWFSPQQNQLLQKLIEEVRINRSSSNVEASIQDPHGTVHYFYHVLSPMIIGETIVGVSIISNNISELKKLEKELERNREIMTLGLDAAEMGTWEWDIQKETVIWDDNHHRLFGWEVGTFGGTFEAFSACIYEEDRERMVQDTLYALEHLDQYGGSYRIVRKDTQEVIWLTFRSKFIRDKDGKAVFMRGVEWDSTAEKERKIMQQKAAELELQNKALKQFTYIASHDLQGPLNTVNNFVGLFEKQFRDQLNERANTYLDFINKAVGRMKTLIKDLLDYSHIGQNRKFDMIDCNQIVHQVLDNLHHAIYESQAEIQLSPLPKIVGSETDIVLLFQNLISNAIKFHRKGIPPRINITAHKDDDDWTFSVEDNGIGVEDIYKDKIFEIFQRLHNQDEFEGTGIGLAHCQKIVELHSGTIWLKSTPGYGSTFFFSIPTAI
ncbi:MAG: PAS domain S-box protein [Bacteroidota bacterium]